MREIHMYPYLEPNSYNKLTIATIKVIKHVKTLQSFIFDPVPRTRITTLSSL